MRKNIFKLSFRNSYFHHFLNENKLVISLINIRKNDNIINFQVYIIIFNYLEKYIHFINDYIIRNFFFKIYFNNILFVLKK